MVGPILIAVMMAGHNFSKNITPHLMPFHLCCSIAIFLTLCFLQMDAPIFLLDALSVSLSRKGQSWPNLDDYSSIACIGSVLV